VPPAHPIDTSSRTLSGLSLGLCLRVGSLLVGPLLLPDRERLGCDRGERSLELVSLCKRSTGRGKEGTSQRFVLLLRVESLVHGDPPYLGFKEIFKRDDILLGQLVQRLLFRFQYETGW
jgi:hypothetical protein